MYEVKINLLKNRLYITFGRIFSNEIKEIAQEIAYVSWELRPGFTCITKINDYRGFEKEELEQIVKIQDYLLSIGMAKVVRVGFKAGTEALENTGRKVGYRSKTAPSVAEAERILDKFVSTQSGKKKQK